MSDAITGCLLGTALGDALGLWCEGMSARRQHSFHVNLDRFHFLFGKGMVSDDTEHACMVAQALIASAGDEEQFRRTLAWRLRWWFAGLPAGIGRATALSLIKLWLGFSPERSGVFSAGNGPAMRSPILGVCFGHAPDRLRQLVRASTKITHTDPKAEYGALAVAVAAHLAATRNNANYLGDRFLEQLRVLLPVEAAPLLELLDGAVTSAGRGEMTEEYARQLGLGRGVTGYMYHTVPVVIQAWLRHRGDFLKGVTAVIHCGGDTDSTAAILGGIVGAGVGESRLPRELFNNLWEWPCSVRWIRALGQQLHSVTVSGVAAKPLRVFIVGQLLRNLFFLVVVLVHGFRRCFPPY